MEIEKDYYSTYAFYDSKGNRYSSFARRITVGADFTEGGTREVIELFTVKCSRRDQLDKQLSKLLYEIHIEDPKFFHVSYEDGTPYVYHPEVVHIDIENGRSVKYSFLKWKENNFYKKHVVLMEQDYLACMPRNEVGKAIGKPRVSELMNFIEQIQDGNRS